MRSRRSCSTLLSKILCVAALCCTAPLVAAQDVPSVPPDTEADATPPRYEELKQVYDVAIQAADTETRSLRMTHVLNVAAYHMGMTPLEDLHLTAADRGETAPEIVIVLHGGELELFAAASAETHSDLLATARALHDAGVNFRACRGAAWLMHELASEDMVDFVEMVPGGEAEVAWLQQQGYGYNFFQLQ